jgi:hypothetical protein
MNSFSLVKLEGQRLLILKLKIKKRELVKTKQQQHGIQTDSEHSK